MVAKRSSPVLPDGSICRPDLLRDRYARPFADGNYGDGLWATGKGFWIAGDVRTPTERDRARLRYSNLFYRLGGVTQVISPPTATDFFHNRLAHSLKVADLAGAMAADQTRKASASKTLMSTILELGGLDVAACEAAGLAHDLGHPPFGHVAEGTIDYWLREGKVGEQRCANGFEGNAQSFRTVTRLSLRNDDALGLELTAVTLAAILKYPWLREIGSVKREGKFGAYHAEGQLRDASREWFERDGKRDDLTQTLEASIMDLADDITYAVHDLQDFITAKIIHVNDVSNGLTAAHQFLTDLLAAEATKVDGSVDSELTDLLAASDIVSPFEAQKFVNLAVRLEKYYPGQFSKSLFLRGLELALGTLGLFDDPGIDVQREASMRSRGSGLIADFMKSVRVTKKPGWPHGPHLYLEQEQWHHVQILKEITKAFVVDTPAVGLHQESETSALLGLLDALETWVVRTRRDGTENQLPKDLQLALITVSKPEHFSLREDDTRNYRDNPVSRAIVDYVCSLTDMGAHRLSKFLRGHEVARIVL